MVLHEALEGEREGGFAQGAKSERGARWGGGGGGVAPAASLLFSPLCPLINMQMQDVCNTPGCQIKSNENLADLSERS